MDEGSGTIAYDYSGYGNNGTLHGGIVRRATAGTNETFLNQTQYCDATVGLPQGAFVGSIINVSGVERVITYHENKGSVYCTSDWYQTAWADNITGFTSGSWYEIYNHGDGVNGRGPKWKVGRNGNGLNFDGIDDYVRISTSYSNIEIATFSVWIMPTLPDTHGCIVCRDESHDGSGIFFNSGFLCLGPRGPGSGYCSNSFMSSTDYGKWFHLTVIADYNNGRASFYVNGSLNRVVTFSRGTASLFPGNIGSWNGGRWVFNGTIDEVRIYNRALSEEEIKQLYYNGLTNKFNITIGLLNFGFADLGKSFNAIVYLRNGTILQLPLTLDRDLTRGSYLENNLTIDGYYPSYGLVDKVMVCSNDCQGVCSEIIVNNQC
jgi:hypothetical protein